MQKKCRYVIRKKKKCHYLCHYLEGGRGSGKKGEGRGGGGGGHER
jgi:hypothetical protein